MLFSPQQSAVSKDLKELLDHSFSGWFPRLRIYALLEHIVER